MINQEVWKPVLGYEELYEVSNFGNVKSKDRKVFNGKGYYIKKGRLLKKSLTTTGYWKVELYKNGKKRSKRVHRLVAETFIPKIKGKELINHKDGNPLNNHVSNLEWCDQSENMLHANRIGLRANKFHKYKKRILAEYTNNEKATIRGLAKKYGCSYLSIKNYLEKMNVEIRDLSQIKDIYKIDRKEMVAMFDKGIPNKEIAKRFKTNRKLIGVYKHLYKKGELKI